MAEENTIHITPRKIEIHLSETLLIQKKCRQKSNDIELPGKTIHGILFYLTRIQQQNQQWKSHRKPNGQRYVSAVISPHLPKTKSDSALIALRRYKDTAVLIQQINKGGKKTQPQLHRRQEIPKPVS